MCFSISSPRVRMCGVRSYSPTSSRTSALSYALSRQMPCGVSSVGSGRSIGIESSVGFSNLWSLRLAPSWSSPIGTPAPSEQTERFAPF